MEIRLRAWDKINKRMIYVESFSQIPSNWKNVWILMLSTTLHDRHGKEIWEGDRVKYTSHSGYNMEDFIAVIKWCEEGACWGYKRETEMYVSYFSGHDELFKDVLPYLEVIGNIYESPIDKEPPC